MNYSETNFESFKKIMIYGFCMEDMIFNISHEMRVRAHMHARTQTHTQNHILNISCDILKIMFFMQKS